MKINEIIHRMAEYEAGNAHNINHALKVYSFAKTIGEAEGLSEEEQTTLEIAAVLHDIGIKKSIEKYGSSAGTYQEQEGPSEARDLLAPLSLPTKIVDRVCWLIAHHHTYGEIVGQDYQILVEADFLVNIDESRMQSGEIQKIREKIFRTTEGKKLLDDLFPIRRGDLSSEEKNLLTKEAISARSKAYSPYSHFSVGAALLTETGRIYTGCNIESASYSPTNCAERTAFFKAVGDGEREFRAIAIVGGKVGEPISSFCPPCGVCRQVMAEFCRPDFQICLIGPEGEWEIWKLKDLLPLGFGPENL